MATNLRKYKYHGSATSRPGSSSDESTPKTPKAAAGSTSSNANANVSPREEEQLERSEMDIAELKSELLLSIKKDIAGVLKEELKKALAEDFDDIKTQLRGVKDEIANCKEATRKEIEEVKATVKDLGNGLSTWSDEVTTLQTTVTALKKEMTDLKNKCDDLEGRMRRCNIRILGVPETPDSSTTTAVTRLLREVLHMDKNVLIDRSHRSLVPRRPGGKPRAIIAKLHYYQDCVDVLRLARTQAPLILNGQSVAIFPDFTPSVARNRAAFTEARKLLRDQPGVRFGIMFPARLRITHNGEEKEFVDPVAAVDYIRKYVIKT